MPVTTSHQDAATKTVDVGGTSFAYRDLGPRTGTPVVFLNHLAAVLDNWDPRVVDGIAARHRVITFDSRGVGASEGSTPVSVADMAHDAVAFIRALGFDQVDLLGFSLGGFLAQVNALEEPELVRKIILAGTGTGTGPAGDVGIERGRRPHRPGRPAWCADLEGPEDLSFLHPDTERQEASRAVPGSAEGANGEPRQGALHLDPARSAHGDPRLGPSGTRRPVEDPPPGPGGER